jgi:D-alanine-D-alanine ligase
MDNYDEALKLAKEIFTLFKQDVLIEEFVEGKEISLVFSGNSKGIKISEAVEIVFEDGNGGLSNRLYSFEIKKENDLKIFNKLATDIIPDSVFESAKRIFRLLGKVENLRIDGRFNNGNFSLIELSPDIHYGKGSTFSYAFEKKGYAYEEMMKILIENAIRDV